jgi:hypothetical protein|tara:strand:+ start:29606 stop:29917 length:312 start_codon:yes stop_codon:yes gene_type:complete
MNRLEERWGQLTDAEEAARDALSDSIGRVTDINISELNLATHRAISAYLSALESQGLKIVPVEPTEAMARVYAERFFMQNWEDPFEDTFVRPMWAAMLNSVEG